MNATCVIHLARAQNGLKPYQAFLDSYRRYPAGRAHDLLIVLKGFHGRQSEEQHRRLAAGLNAHWLSMNDLGFDLRAYRLAALSVSNRYVCLLNSFSELLAVDWLKKLESAIQLAGVGLAGATGSCESMLTNLTMEPVGSRHSSWQQAVWRPLRKGLCRACFPPFPNHHLRTNGLIIPRDIMMQVWPRLVLTKRACYMFESGKNNLTNRVERRNLKSLVVDCNGDVYEKEEWSKSRTYRLSRQENLLIADNQTRLFAASNPIHQKYLRTLAWGNAAS